MKTVRLSSLSMSASEPTLVCGPKSERGPRQCTTGGVEGRRDDREPTFAGVVDEVEGDDGGVALNLLTVAGGGRLRAVDRRKGNRERRCVVTQLLGEIFAADFAV